MTDFYKSETYLIVKKMQDSGNQPGVIALWKAMAQHWAERNHGADAEAVKALLPLWAVRPFYTAQELAPLMPALASALGIRKQPGPMKSANRLANELQFAGVPFRDIDGKRYFAVERLHYWRTADAIEWEKELAQ